MTVFGSSYDWSEVKVRLKCMYNLSYVFYLNLKFRCASTGLLRLTTLKVFPLPVNWFERIHLHPNTISNVNQEALVLMKKIDRYYRNVLIWALFANYLPPLTLNLKILISNWNWLFLLVNFSNLTLCCCIQQIYIMHIITNIYLL